MHPIRKATRLVLAGAALAALSIVPSGGATAQGPATAIFAGGCFWCVESDFDHVEGVLDTVSGYIGGEVPNPTYENHEGHVEAVRITFDPATVSYDELLTVFWHSVDPTDSGGQFCDRGFAYTTAIFAVDEAQRAAAEASKAAAAASLGQAIVTPIRAAPQFFEAEDYHQDYHEKNPLRYNYYRYACGREERVNEVWGEDAYLGIKDAMS